MHLPILQNKGEILWSKILSLLTTTTAVAFQLICQLSLLPIPLCNLRIFQKVLVKTCHMPAQTYSGFHYTQGGKNLSSYWYKSPTLFVLFLLFWTPSLATQSTQVTPSFFYSLNVPSMKLPRDLVISLPSDLCMNLCMTCCHALLILSIFFCFKFLTTSVFS